MATKSENPKPPKPLPSVIQAYWLPAILFCASMFFQLVAIPRSFPPSHYDGFFLSYLLTVPPILT
ncbi:hypothetical protein Hdeb2414_s0687g00935751 [Helianthus debilis subsp. tardiflorus]